ncbi:hypothetical protein GCM10009845_26120 [Pedococcus bigeumensis]
MPPVAWLIWDSVGLRTSVSKGTGHKPDGRLLPTHPALFPLVSKPVGVLGGISGAPAWKDA